MSEETRVRGQIPLPVNFCDVCGKPRSSGNNKLKHVKCSQIRKARCLAAKQK